MRRLPNKPGHDFIDNNNNYYLPGLRPPGRRKSCPKLSPPRNEFSQSPPGKPLIHSIRLIIKRSLLTNGLS
ncbi:hypothetical protein DERP_013086 [Dermatophagoides pteronyssinus]|uniref:Uncharacterized protein n=1 Tax=Dermatophagoides pteronyssinus TaxID=6956 RepID=A0ABQ8J5J6_DERPT|nr:hypothetical protein DERP_013086 [Dermatophagoides pteronyssinus]